jgi:excisionase family DNA binding protein
VTQFQPGLKYLDARQSRHPIEGLFRMPKNTARDRLSAGGRRWASIQDAADYLDIHPRTIRKMAADGRLTLYRSGARLVRVDLNELDANMTPAQVS